MRAMAAITMPTMAPVEILEESWVVFVKLEGRVELLLEEVMASRVEGALEKTVCAMEKFWRS